MSKIVNITLEENATFSKLLTFTYPTLVSDGVHPITKQPMYKKVLKPIPLNGYTFLAEIKDSFSSDTVIVSLNVQVLDATSGRVMVSLSKEQTAVLDKFVNWSTNYGRYSERIGLLGYYDILAIKNGTGTRVMQGQCYFSRSVTSDVNSLNTSNISVMRSELTPIGDNIELFTNSAYPHCYAGIEYYKGGKVVTPTSGMVDIFRSPETTRQFMSTTTGILNSKEPVTEISWHANTYKVKAVPQHIQGADNYKLTVVCNRS